MELGAQLFTLRDFCKTLPDFAETLKKVADMGYKTVQVSGTCAYEADWLKAELEKNGLRCVLTHTPMDKIRDKTAQVIADHKTFGCEFVGIGCAPNCFAKGDEDWLELTGVIEAAAKPLADNGMRLMYHNHACEFQRRADRRTYYEHLLEYEHLGFTFDTFWAQWGGMTVTDLIRSLKGRIPCVHLKDLAVRVNTPCTAPVGWGNLDFDAILAACADAEARYLLVEQDDCFEEDPFDCLRKSYEFLRSRGLE